MFDRSKFVFAMRLCIYYGISVLRHFEKPVYLRVIFPLSKACDQMQKSKAICRPTYTFISV